MKEAEYATRVEETANFLGLRWHHETDSRKSKAGFPDYVFVGPYGVLFLELKSDKGKATPQQEAWIRDLAVIARISHGCGAVEAYVAYPRDWNRVLSDLKRIAGR
jgi:hypothetical protein